MATPAAILNILVQTQGLAKTQGDIRGLDKDLGKAGKTGSSMGGAIKKAAGIVGGVVAFDTLRRGVSGAIGEFEEARKVGAQTTNVIKTTGGAANVTAKQVATLATAISKKTGIDDEAIQSGANLLLTFKNVANEVGRGNKIFDRATKAAVDLSAAGFGDLTSTSKQLGKALNDPIKGISALSRSGVTFTEQQKAKIKSLVEEGKTLKAQKIIMQEVESQVKGSAAAQATSFDHLKVTIGNLAEAAGSVLVPAFDKVATFANTLFNQMIEGKSTGGAIITVFKGIGGATGKLITTIKDLVGWFKQHETVAMALGAALGVVLAAFVGFKILAAVQAAIIAVRAAMIGLNAAFLANPVVLVVAGIAALVAGLVIAYRESETFRKIVDAVGGALVTAAKAVFDFVKNIGDAPAKMLEAGKAILNAIVDGIKSLAGQLDDVAKWLLKTAFEAIKLYYGSYLTVGKWVLNRIIDGVKAVASVVASAATWLKDKLVESVKAAVSGYAALGTWVLNRIVDGFKVVTDLLGTVGTWLKNRFVDFVKGAIDGYVAVGSWVLNRVVDGFKTVTDALGNVGTWLLDKVKGIFREVKDGFVSVGGTLIGWIVDGLKGGLKLLAGFVNKILNVINRIPGVDIKPIDVSGLAKGGTFGASGASQAFARGGAYAKTRGVVNSPITLMGEEAPRHPEFVIPTNPAYRKRARGLLAQAAGAIGFAKGGKYDRDFGQGSSATIPFDAAAQLAEAAGLPGITYAQIAIGESGLRPGAVSSDGGYGLWQMTPRVQSRETVLAWQKIGSYFNPWNNAQMAKVLAGSGTGTGNYYGTSSVTDWNKHYTGSTDGYIPSGFSNGPSLNPMDLLKKLPGTGDLGWLKGTGDMAIEKAKAFIKQKLGGILGRSVPGWGALDRLASSLGLSITSTLRPGDNGYHGQPLGISGRARATDYSNGTAGTPEMLAFAKAVAGQYGNQLKELIHTPLGFGIKNGQRVGMDFPFPWDSHYNHVHVAFAKGGEYGGLPYVGAYANGGIVPQTGMALVHRGETITPADGGDIVLNATIDLGEGIERTFQVKFDRRTRQQKGAYSAGRAG